MSVPNTVFISYAWESAEFRERVKALRDYLLASDFTVVTDFDHANRAPAEAWQAWMQHQIEDATVVLIVCSPSYKARFEKRAPIGSGNGVAWEGMVITQDLYDAAMFNKKFYPIFPEPLQFDDCPKALRGYSNGHSFPANQAGIVALLRECLGLPPQVSAATSLANPFQPWKPAVGPHFFGREDALRTLHQALDQTRSVSLVGDRRIGKSSLLQTWQAKARLLGRKVVLLDGTQGEAASCIAFAKAITGKEIAQDNAELAADAIEAWAAAQSALAPLILLDEAEKCIKDLPHRLFERFRGMIAYQKICLVLATATPIEEVYQGTGHTSPIINLLEFMRIGLLDSAASEQLIGLGNALLGDTQRAVMRNWAGRHPYFLALCGNRLWEAAQHGTPIDDVLAKLNDEASGRMLELWKTFSDREKRALQEIGQGSAKVPDKLRLRGVVIKEGQHERLFGEVLAHWLEEQA